jgi:hypothetical protein
VPYLEKAQDDRLDLSDTWMVMFDSLNFFLEEAAINREITRRDEHFFYEWLQRILLQMMPLDIEISKKDALVKYHNCVVNEIAEIVRQFGHPEIKSLYRILYSKFRKFRLKWYWFNNPQKQFTDEENFNLQFKTRAGFGDF